MRRWRRRREAGVNGCGRRSDETTREVGMARSVNRMQLSGADQMIITVSRQLTVNITGPGTVSYSGDASVEKSITGVGQLIKR
jgi:hypothetical protein